VGATQEPKFLSQRGDTLIQNHDDAYFAPLGSRQVKMDRKYNALTIGVHQGIIRMTQM
jgi:hypothetical protein